MFCVGCWTISTVRNSTFELQQRPPLKESLANYKWNIRGGRLRDSVFHKVAQLFCWVAPRFHTTSQKRTFYAPHSTPRSPESAPSCRLDLVLPDCLFFSQNVKCMEVSWRHMGCWRYNSTYASLRRRDKPQGWAPDTVWKRPCSHDLSRWPCIETRFCEQCTEFISPNKFAVLIIYRY